MSKKNIVMFVVLAVLGGLYLVYFTDLFQAENIEINTRVRPNMPSRRNRTVTPAPGASVTFLLNNKYELTSVRVVAETDAKTNKYPHALWHLVTDSNSVPTKSLFYGANIQGMKPKFAKTKAEPLQPDTTYVLQLEAGKAKGQTTFKAR